MADLVGLEPINALSRAIGMQGTTHRYGIPPGGMAGYRPADATNATTPADVGLLLELILQARTILPLLPGCACRPRVSWAWIFSAGSACATAARQTPLGTRVAHKTGTTAQNYNDAGSSTRTASLFILTAYTDRVPVRAARRSRTQPPMSSLVVCAGCATTPCVSRPL